ncbi:hypothetical protein [Cytobacillus sp. IB215316]|uniref:hypothetical protein n=1 Tax=Cytobacillus sp. IB215316 TaxID=3097354 RepID=UPI002A172712|nr:hypothetical protein [Cytobacillus sp. IB215316]MDX8363355.1 hypothetical protein [Cytobacillus sp. IB215316]
MKKFRGKKRYFRNLKRKVMNFEINCGNDSWFDFWHIHLDFYGRGNRNLKVRREHIKAHISLYNNLLKKLEQYDKEYQSWVYICEDDTGSDAVYIHTPNPNYDYFPHQIRDLQWKCEIPKSFKDLIDLNKYNIGYYKSKYEEAYFIQSKFHGIRL